MELRYKNSGGKWETSELVLGKHFFWGLFVALAVNFIMYGVIMS